MKKTIPIKVLAIAILIMIGFIEARGQVQVSGTVLDDQGISLIGVTVSVEGETGIGTITDADGKYSIANLTNESVIVFSFIGYKTVKETVAGRSVIDVTLSTNIEELEEVVVIGYGSVSKEDLTGSVASVRSKDLQRTVNTSLQEALDGRAAGVQVLNGQGSPGGDISIRIRGGTSLTASNEPLYVIDGFPIEVETEIDDPAATGTTSGALSGIDPKDIASIEILKDASATAIYGSRGSNGVVIITTKSGRSGKGTLTYSGFVSAQELPEQIEVMDAVEYAQYRSEQGGAVDQDGNPIFVDPESFADRNINWQDEVYQTAVIHSHNVGISGGTKLLNYNVSLGAFLNEGIIKTSSFDRYNARIKLSGDLSPKSSFNMNLYSVYTEQGGAPTGGGVNASTGTVIQALRFNPIARNEEDSDDPANDIEEGIAFDPINILDNTLFNNERNEIYANFGYDYKITNDLTLSVKLGANSRDAKVTRFWTSNTGQGRQTNGRAVINNNKSKGFLNENLLRFKKKINNHNITAVAGASYQTTSIEQFAAVTENFVIQDLGANNLSLGQIPQIPTSNIEEFTILSGLARVIYSYKGKYNITASFRADGSSRFAKGNQWGYFPSVAGSWNLHREGFLSNNNIINRLKLRVGYGETGNQQIPRYQSLATLSIDGYTFGPDGSTPATSFGILRVANPDLSWETAKQWNLGFDFALFDSRVSGSVDVYDKKTEDLLLAVNLIPTSGIGAPAVQNIGSMRNQGLEISIRTLNVNTPDFQWFTSFNIAFNTNEILDLGSNERLFVNTPGKPGPADEVILEPGRSIGTFYGFRTDGIYGTDADTTLWGRRRYLVNRDTDGDGELDSLFVTNAPINSDRVPLGSAVPKHTGGITNDFTYKNWELSVFFNWSYGNKVYNATRGELELPLQTQQNMSTAVLNRWTPENQDTDIAAVNLGQDERRRLLDRDIEDGSFLRLRSVKLAYNFQNSIVQNIYFSAQNLFTWTNYKGYNPEASVGRNPVAPGVDWGAYPLPRIYTLGFNLKF
ncbi:MAG: TonB-dependent receptor [Bacteroidota bacterium]